MTRSFVDLSVCTLKVCPTESSSQKFTIIKVGSRVASLPSMVNVVGPIDEVVFTHTSFYADGTALSIG